MNCTYETEHYIFTYAKGSPAEKDIQVIADIQEKCFEKICSFLWVNYPRKIRYFLYDSPYTIGKYLLDDESNWCCGLAETTELSEEDRRLTALEFENGELFEVVPYSVHTVYNETVKAIGAHEDTHVISAMINDDAYGFLCEGLAQCMEGTWQGLANAERAGRLYEAGSIIVPSEVLSLSSDEFYDLDYNVSYPYAGAWTEFFVEKYGAELFKKLYSCNNNVIEELEKITGVNVMELDKDFFGWLEVNKNRKEEFVR